MPGVLKHLENDTRPKKEIGMNLGNESPPPLKENGGCKIPTKIISMCPLVLQNLVLRIPLLHGCWGSCVQQIQAKVEGNMQQMLVGGGGI